MVPSRLLAVGVAAALAGCGATPPPEPAPTPAPPPPPPIPRVELPADWRESSEAAFAADVEARLPGEPRRFAEADLAALAEALGARGPAVREAVRAAVLLGRARHPDAAEVLLTRLEQRVPGDERYADAVDVVAATALAELPEPPDAGRLAALAVGPQPHPDLEVRVECARTALLLGDDTVAPFLISVLRIGTPAGRAEGTFWPAPPRTAWARGRAAEVLAWRTGAPNRYGTDASLADRDAQADRFAEALARAR